MRKIIGALLCLLLLTQSAFCLNSYFFLTSTIQMGTEKDSATVICEKYTQGKYQIYFGDNVAACAIECVTDPDITEIVQMKSRTQIINLVHPNLPDLNGSEFISKWEAR